MIYLPHSFHSLPCGMNILFEFVITEFDVTQSYVPCACTKLVQYKREIHSYGVKIKSKVSSGFGAIQSILRTSIHGLVQASVLRQKLINFT